MTGTGIRRGARGWRRPAGRRRPRAGGGSPGPSTPGAMTDSWPMGPDPSRPGRWSPSPPTTTSGCRTHPAVVAGPPTGPRALGCRVGGVAPGDRLPARCTTSSRRRWPTGRGPRRAVVLPTGFAANLAVLSVFGAEGAVVHSDELNHASIIDGCRLARAEVRVYPHRDLGRLDASLASASGAADHRVRHRVLHGRGRRRPRRPGRRGPTPRGPPRARRGPRRARTGPRRPPRGRRPAGGDAVQDTRVPGRIRGRTPPVLRPAGQPRPPLHLHHRPHPGRRRRRPGRARRPPVGRGCRLRRRLTDLVGRVAGRIGIAGHRSPILPVVLGGEAEAVEASAALFGRGPVGAGHPPPDRPRGHVPSAGHPVGHPHRRPGGPPDGRPRRPVAARGAGGAASRTGPSVRPGAGSAA